jgi:hypothetical protein
MARLATISRLSLAMSRRRTESFQKGNRRARRLGDIPGAAASCRFNSQKLLGRITPAVAGKTDFHLHQGRGKPAGSRSSRATFSRTFPVPAVLAAVPASTLQRSLKLQLRFRNKSKLRSCLLPRAPVLPGSWSCRAHRAPNARRAPVCFSHGEDGLCLQDSPLHPSSSLAEGETLAI